MGAVSFLLAMPKHPADARVLRIGSEVQTVGFPLWLCAMLAGMQRVDVILCGVGRMGRNHLRVLQDTPNFRLRGIVDPVRQDTTICPPNEATRSVELAQQAIVMSSSEA